MNSTNAGQADSNSAQSKTIRFTEKIPYLIAAFLFILLMVTSSFDNFFRDEFYYIACGENLDFGYVDHPPVVALVARLSTILFGKTLIGLRLWPALACAITVLLTAAIARELGGGRFAQSFAALCIPAGTVMLAFFGFFSMNAFEVVLWSLCAYLLIRLINGADPKYWLLFGIVAGIGLQTKYTMAVFGVAVVLGLLLTRQRRLLTSPWPYIGGAIADVIFLPNFIWQVVHGWPTIEFMQNALQYKNFPIGPHEFLLQTAVAMNPLLLPVWLTGLLFFFFSKDRAKYMSLGFIFLICFAIIIAQRSKFYYLLPIFPLLLAAGAVAIERWKARINWKWLRPAIVAIIAITGIFLLPLGIAILPPEIFIPYSKAIGLLETIQVENHERVALPQHLADRHGWREMVAMVAEV